MSGAGGVHARHGSSTAVEIGLHGHPLNPIPHRHYHDATNMNFGPGADPSGSSDPRSDGIMGRTPSPTPSELRELRPGSGGWGNPRERFWLFATTIVLIALVALVFLYHKQIVRGLTPPARWLHDTAGAFTIPIAILFVISFPPLFGHAVVSILCGFVWGLGIGLGIVAVGTLLGEIGYFYSSKFFKFFRDRADKMERMNISHACLLEVVRDGGPRITVIARLSAIPAQSTTKIFSTCGVGIILFIFSTLLSMPKQALGVCIGVLLLRSRSESRISTENIVASVILAVIALTTAVSTWYIVRQMDKAKPQVIYRRRKARQANPPGRSASPIRPFLNAAPGNSQSIISSESMMFNSQNDTVHHGNPKRDDLPQVASLPPIEDPQPKRLPS